MNSVSAAYPEVEMVPPRGPTPAAIRCLLVDDHPAVRLGLSELLRAEPGIDVIDALATSESALEVAQQARVDVAVVDYQLPGRSGLWLCRKLKRLPNPPAVLIYSAFSDHLLVAASVVAEADGLVSKAALGATLCEEIRAAASGSARLPTLPPSLGASIRYRLDPREQAIYGLLVAGVDTPDIGRTLGIPERELEAQLWVMLRKLEVLDRGR